MKNSARVFPTFYHRRTGKRLLSALFNTTRSFTCFFIDHRLRGTQVIGLPTLGVYQHVETCGHSNEWVHTQVPAKWTQVWFITENGERVGGHIPMVLATVPLSNSVTRRPEDGFPRPSRWVVDRTNLGCWPTVDTHIPSIRNSHPLS